jgi:hypothetical protein
MAVKFSNNASATLASSINSSVTSVAVTSGQGALFPSLSAGEFFFATLVDSSNNLEIVKVTARSTDTLTVVRGQDGTTARSYSAGDRLELRVVSASFDTMVQTDNAQTITGAKTFSGAVTLSGGGTFSGAVTLSGGGTITGTYAGNHTYSGVVTFGQTIVGSINGNAATVTNGVYTTGDQTINGTKTFGNSVVVNNISVTVGTNTSGGGGNLRLKKDDGTVQWVAGILGSAGATSYEWYNNVAGSTRMTLDTSGNLTASANITAYSDERLKKDWAPVAADFVSKLSGVKSGTYTRIDSDIRQAGVSAQSLQEILPETVMEDIEGTLSVAYGNAALVAAVELAKKVVELQSRLEVLEAK